MPPRGANGGKIAPAAPSAKALPKPPPAPSLGATAPSTTTSLETQTSEAQQRLDALLGTLRSSREHLSPEVAKILGEQEVQDVQQHAKALQRVVQSQSHARRELQKTRVARQTYVQSWLSYVEHLSTLLQQQFKEQEDALQAFSESETKWQDQLADACGNLARLSSGTGHIDSDDPDSMDARMKVAEPETDPWNTEEAVKDLKARQQALVATLQRGHEQAVATVSDAKRDGSRTPRRTPKESKDGDIEPTAKEAVGTQRPKDAQA